MQEVLPPAQELYTAVKSNPYGKDTPQQQQVPFSLLLREMALPQIAPCLMTDTLDFHCVLKSP